MKYSIIIPVYNVEKYLVKCLDSILNQTYNNYEILIVDDASTDKSRKILEEYSKKFTDKIKLKLFDDNKGASIARNEAIKMALGDYLVFIDADDYVNNDFLKKVDKIIENNKDIDIVRIKRKFIEAKTGKVLKETYTKKNKVINGKKAFIYMRKKKMGIDPPWFYIIKKQYWKENKFEFAPGKLIEDFGLIPLVVIKAKTFLFSNEPIYYHVKRENSLMTNNDYERLVKRANDTICHYDYLIEAINNFYGKNDFAKKVYIQYVTDRVFEPLLKYLKENEKKKLCEEIEKRNMISKLKVYSLKSFLKKVLYSMILYVYKKEEKNAENK